MMLIAKSFVIMSFGHEAGILRKDLKFFVYFEDYTVLFHTFLTARISKIQVLIGMKSMLM